MIYHHCLTYEFNEWSEPKNKSPYSFSANPSLVGSSLSHYLITSTTALNLDPHDEQAS